MFVRTIISGEMGTGIIYKAIGPTGKVYIGKTTTNINSRRTQHCSNAFNKNHSAYNTKFYRAIRKHEKNKFIWSVLLRRPEKDLNKCERRLIHKFNSYKLGYNSTLGGEGTLGLKHTQLVKDKLSKISSKRNSGKGNPRYGVKISQETKDKISASHVNKKLSQEHKQKIACSLRGREISERARKQMSLSRGAKEFMVFTEDKEYIGRWGNQRKCAKDIGVGRNQIRACLKGSQRSSKGYLFVYLEKA